jgi:hypothetical protein
MSPRPVTGIALLFSFFFFFTFYVYGMLVEEELVIEL